MMSQFSASCRQLGGSGGAVQTDLEQAIDAGTRFIDTAHVFVVETKAGVAINNKIVEGVVKREDLVIVGKLWNTYGRPDVVQTGIKRTLMNLGVSYVDLYIIHWPFREYFSERDTEESESTSGKTASDIFSTWKAILAVIDQGFAKTVGLSDVTTDKIKLIRRESLHKTKQALCGLQLVGKSIEGSCFSACKRKSWSVTIPNSSNPSRILNDFKVFDYELTLRELGIQVCEATRQIC